MEKVIGKRAAWQAPGMASISDHNVFFLQITGPFSPEFQILIHTLISNLRWDFPYTTMPAGMLKQKHRT